MTHRAPAAVVAPCCLDSTGWAYAKALTWCTVVADTPEGCAEAAMALVVERLGHDWFGRTPWADVDWAEWADVVEGKSIRVVPA